MIRVLIADDEMIERKYLNKLFHKYPHKYSVIGEARNGQEVVQQVSIHHPDVIIMDINMPLMSGLTSAQKIKQLFPDTIILLNTAYAEFEFAQKAIEYHLDAYLLKPAREDLILRTIDECMKKRKKRFTSAPSAYAAELANRPVNNDDPIELVTDYIDKNPQLSLSLEELAQIAHFTPSYLSRIFREKKGITVTAYITQKRLENAKFLLIQSPLSIQEIASHCGFRTISHFNRVFKQNIDCSPQEFRHRSTYQEEYHAKL